MKLYSKITANRFVLLFNCSDGRVSVHLRDDNALLVGVEIESTFQKATSFSKARVVTGFQCTESEMCSKEISLGLYDRTVKLHACSCSTYDGKTSA